MLSRWLGRAESETRARALYGAIVAQARRPEFYAAYGVPDTLDGRFEMISLHAFLVLQRMKREHGRTREAAQALFDEMFADIDRSLRELGAGDLGVGRRVKTMAKAFYGRISSYETALAGREGALESAIVRGPFGSVESDADAAAVTDLARYVRDAFRSLHAQDIEQILAGRVEFASPHRPEVEAP